MAKKPQKNNNSSNFFQHLRKWILCKNFIHDIDHSVTNYNKTSWNSVPVSKVFSCLDNLWYLSSLQVKKYHHNWPWKTTKLGGFQQKISFRQLRHMTITFEKKGKRLAGPHHFGFDPPHENIQMQEICTRRFYEIFLNAEHIFTIWEM